MTSSIENQRDDGTGASAWLGRVLAGRYRLDAVLGVGGSGMLFSAQHVRSGRDVAVKLLRDGRDSTLARLRFEREGRAVALSRHPHVVELIDSGEAECGTPFLVMEWLRGRSLHAVIVADGPLTGARMFEWLAPVLGALSHAHAQGVLHRDIKPANLFVLDSPHGGRPTSLKLLDFGVAKLADAASLTGPGRVLGTGGFMSPEQLRGDELSPASDVWSLGVVMFVCLTGALPFSEEQMGSGTAPTPRAVQLTCPDARAFMPVIERALEWSPRARYPSAAALAHALLAVAARQGMPIDDSPDPIGLPEWPRWREALEQVRVTITHAHVGPAVSPSASPAASPEVLAYESPLPAAESGMRAALPQSGTTLLDRFELLGPLGSGAMGTVLEARDSATGEVVALKVLHRLEPSAIYRLKKEFRALCRIVHPNLIALHELFSDAHGRFFFTMERLHGRPLVDFVRSGPAHAACDHDRLRSAFSQLATGVRHLHELGTLHRDLKPSNVLVESDGRVVIVDFGLAHPFRDRSAAQTEHDFLGTPAYAAPEQIDPAKTGTESDFYAVGVMLYEALTGAWPFQGNSHQIMLSKAQHDPLPPSQHTSQPVPEDLERICMQLLSRDLETRREGAAALSTLTIGSSARVFADTGRCAVRGADSMSSNDCMPGSIARAKERSPRSSSRAPRAWARLRSLKSSSRKRAQVGKRWSCAAAATRRRPCTTKRSMA